jgi:uncharacterized protein YkuJ
MKRKRSETAKNEVKTRNFTSEGVVIQEMKTGSVAPATTFHFVFDKNKTKVDLIIFH